MCELVELKITPQSPIRLLDADFLWPPATFLVLVLGLFFLCRPPLQSRFQSCSCREPPLASVAPDYTGIPLWTSLPFLVDSLAACIHFVFLWGRSRGWPGDLGGCGEGGRPCVHFPMRLMVVSFSANALWGVGRHKLPVLLK